LNSFSLILRSARRRKWKEGEFRIFRVEQLYPMAQVSSTAIAVKFVSRTRCLCGARFRRRMSATKGLARGVRALGFVDDRVIAEQNSASPRAAANAPIRLYAQRNSSNATRDDRVGRLVAIAFLHAAPLRKLLIVCDSLGVSCFQQTPVGPRASQTA
jgi:hypothetical protein